MPAHPSDQVFYSGLKKSEFLTLLKQFGKNVLGPVKLVRPDSTNNDIRFTAYV